MRSSTLFFLVFLFLLNTETLAQQQRFSGWFQIQQDFQLNNKMSLQVENQFRSDNQWKNAEVLETRGGLTYDISNQISFAAGYSFIENWRVVQHVHDNIAEHRLWSQMSKETGSAISIFKQRIRIEERILPIIGIQNEKFFRAGNEMSTRLRYQFKWTRNFPKIPGTELGFYTVFSNEAFMSVTGASHINSKLLDQLRAFLGFGYRFNDHIGIEPGYLLQYVLGRGSSYTQNNVFQLAINMEL